MRVYKVGLILGDEQCNAARTVTVLARNVAGAVIEAKKAGKRKLEPFVSKNENCIYRKILETGLIEETSVEIVCEVDGISEELV